MRSPSQMTDEELGEKRCRTCKQQIDIDKTVKETVVKEKICAFGQAFGDSAFHGTRN